MPLFLLFVGSMLLISGAKGTTGDLSALLKEDFKPTDGSPGFGTWIAAIILLGATGYVSALKPISNAFLVLLLIVLVLANQKGSRGGFFIQFKEAVL